MWGPGAAASLPKDAAELLLLLCRIEVQRLKVWARPLLPVPTQPGSAAAVGAASLTPRHVKTAWQVRGPAGYGVLHRTPP